MFQPTYTIVSIEGNIGSGKSTLLESLKNRLSHFTEIIFVNEPVDEWSEIKDENGTTILEKFYADQEKYSFPFQLMAYISRLKNLKNVVDRINKMGKQFESKRYVIIMERSLYTDRFVFAKMMFDSGKMEFVNYQIYLKWFDAFIENFVVHKIIYVKASPEICFTRISTRGREGESSIPLEYLQNCSKYHDEMIDMLTEVEKTVLDGNQDIKSNPEILENWLSDIELYL
jgi:deoxyadenosine/deoxycytidine kinase